MKLPEFDRSKMFWDNWQAFYVIHTFGDRFIQFDTGEFVICQNRWHPDKRRPYNDLHIQVVGTDDRDCPKLFVPHETKPIPKSHLNRTGMQVLLLDHDHQRAVSLEGWMTKDNAGARIPERFIDRGAGRSVRAYYAGPDAFPVGAVPITRHFPHPLTSEQRRHIVELRNACTVWIQMQDNPAALTIEGRREHRDVQTRVDYFVNTPFRDLTTPQRIAIAVRGFDMIKLETNPWLTFKKEEKE